MNNTAAHIELHVRYIKLQPGQEHRVTPLLAQLSAAEQEHAGRFRFPVHRAAYIAAHALRAAMLRRTEASWSAEGLAERPQLVTSLTHTDGLVACGLAQAAAIGIDAEATAPEGDWATLMSRVLAQSERAFLEAQPPSKRWPEFLRYWTLKEAISKALGVGLALPFHAVSLSLVPLQLLDLPQGFGTCRGWHLEEHDPGSSHRMAAAVRHGAAGSVKVVWQPTTIEDVIGSHPTAYFDPL
jgi:4'-phosphopantetheinyl transferase